jgi:hypothetical protein
VVGMDMLLPRWHGWNVGGRSSAVSKLQNEVDVPSGNGKYSTTVMGGSLL